MKELPIRSLPGIPVLIVALLASAAAAWLFFTGMGAGGAPGGGPSAWSQGAGLVTNPLLAPHPGRW